MLRKDSGRLNSLTPRNASYRPLNFISSPRSYGMALFPQLTRTSWLLLRLHHYCNSKVWILFGMLFHISWKGCARKLKISCLQAIQLQPMLYQRFRTYFPAQCIAPGGTELPILDLSSEGILFI
ncbi:hypothetical protein CC86DRAFT_80543 [Ophiobolus disseminans]|uniref:Uncharacterized protein n=1 Tax=Ophiobolus disseminans TaxID=1469910 RepID=A0A6A6ZNZ6_9PLEO|nr:hypothetical protein CC86DRAFT_80543 [Ophiobolus disseminans]